MRILREKLHRDFPDTEFFFSAPDIVSQILNFGIPAPIDIQVTGRDPKGYEIANEIKMRVAQVPGAVDVHVHQLIHGPDLRVNVDRTRAEQIGLTQNDVARTMLISLSSSGQATPNFWLNYQTGVNYQVAVQTPQYKMDTLLDLQNTPVVALNLPRPELLGNLATIERRESPVIVNHYDVQPVFDVMANVQGRDLGGVAGQINKNAEQANKNLPRWRRSSACCLFRWAWAKAENKTRRSAGRSSAVWSLRPLRRCFSCRLFTACCARRNSFATKTKNSRNRSAARKEKRYPESA